MTNTRAQKTKNSETLKKPQTQARLHNDNTDNIKQHGEDNALHPETKETYTTATTEFCKKTHQTLWLHSLCHSTKTPSGKASTRVKKNYGGKAPAQTKRGGKASTRRHDQLEVAKHPPKRISTSRAAKHPPN